MCPIGKVVFTIIYAKTLFTSWNNGSQRNENLFILFVKCQTSPDVSSHYCWDHWHCIVTWSVGTLEHNWSLWLRPLVISSSSPHSGSVFHKVFIKNTFRISEWIVEFALLKNTLLHWQIALLKSYGAVRTRTAAKNTHSCFYENKK